MLELVLDSVTGLGGLTGTRSEAQHAPRPGDPANFTLPLASLATRNATSGTRATAQAKECTQATVVCALVSEEALEIARKT